MYFNTYTAFFHREYCMEHKIEFHLRRRLMNAFKKEPDINHKFNVLESKFNVLESKLNVLELKQTISMSKLDALESSQAKSMDKFDALKLNQVISMTNKLEDALELHQKNQ